MDYPQAIDYLYGLRQFGIRLGLEAITTLLSSLGNPHHGYPSILIAGTNGKGSTAAMLSSILCEAGYRVGLYTSPHLVNLEERIVVDRKQISPAEVAELTGHLKEAISDLMAKGKLSHCPTFFEVLTALAFTYFSQQKVDIAVLEVGLGGRYDATNVVKPLVSVITSVSKDHKEHLGSTVEQIAWEKAGIIKRKGRVVAACRSPIAMGVLERECQHQSAQLWQTRKEVSFRIRERGIFPIFDLETEKDFYGSVRLGLAGEHQILNASTVILVAEHIREMDFTVPHRSVKEGLARVRFPGRLEIISQSPPLILDGAHNPEAVGWLRRFLRQFFPEGLALIFAIMRNKEIEKVMRIILPLARRVILPRLKVDRGAEPVDLLRLGRRYQYHLTTADSVAEAMEMVSSRTEGEAVCATGSFYLVGEIKEL